MRPESKVHTLPPLPQLWYFWRRRLFIWISFLDSYFELLLYVASLLLRLRPRGRCAGGTQRALEGRTQGRGVPRGWNQGQTHEPAVQLGVPSAPIRVEHFLPLTVPEGA